MEPTLATADTWQSRDLPFLRQLVAQIELTPRTRITAAAIGRDLSMDDSDTLRALQNLKRGGYVVESGHPTRLSSSALTTPLEFTDKALYAVGAWPTPETGADRLLAALEALADHADDQSTRTRARSALEQVGGFGRDTLAAIAATVITGQIPGSMK